MPKFQRGIINPILIILVLVLVVSGIFVFTRQRSPTSFNSQRQNDTQDQLTKAEWPVLWGAPDNQNKCQDNPNVQYTALPMAMDDIKFVQPIGELREGHIVPGDHGGIDYKTSPTSTPVKVFMPADGFLVRVEKHPYEPPQGYPKMNHYHVYLEHSCTFFTGFVHVTEFALDILQASPQLKTLDEKEISQFENILLRIPVKAGQQLGTAWSFGLLGWVTVDLTYTNKGYLNPQSYKGENWRIHSVSGFDYLEPSLREKINSKNPRAKEPRGGKIDFDIEGKLVGGWFEKGTGGFRDVNVAPKQCGNFPCPYWEGHLALVYDYVDPSQLRVSVGYNFGLSDRTPFGVKGNSPDFKDIGVENGLVKYELVALKDISQEKGYDTEGGSALITLNDDSKSLGILLAQVVDKDSIKVEIFPGKTQEQVNGFSSKVRVYHR